MNRHIGRAANFVGILLLITFGAATKARAQGTPPPPIPTQNSLTAVTDMHGPAIGEEFTELAAGVFTYSKTDLSLPGPMPINVTRVYRSEDITSGSWNNRAFGIGTRLNYDIFLYTSGSNEYVSMPDSSYLTCTLSGSEFLCNSEPSGVWFGSTISGSTLTRPDGTIYSFDSTSKLLVSITDRFNNSITITRGAAGGSLENSACHSGTANGRVPQYYVGTVSSSNGRAVYFCYDDHANNPYNITGIADNASPTIKKVTYSYNSGSTLATVTQANSTHAVTTYQYGQTPPNARGDVTTIIVNDSCPSSGGCGSPNQVFTYITYMTDGLGTVLASISSQLPGNGYTYNYNSPGIYPASHVTVSLPDNATRDFYFDSAGYVYKDVRNISASKPEYTFFDRGQQTVGQSAEFVGEVDEDDSNGTTVLRKTTYNYDTNTGNILSTTLSPSPGQSSGSTTWNYTYTTYNRIASFLEPLANNGVGTTYSYTDSPSTHTMTVTDPLSNALTTTYNAQGQPVSIPNALSQVSGKYTTMQYYSNGDVQWMKDPLLNQTSYVTDPDGRVLSMTSPLNEKTQYLYDAIDDVTQVTDPLNNVTKYTYDLIGEVASSTTPRGYTTTTTRSPNLAKTTVTDPLGNQTVTNLDGMGRSTDYTDKRGIETTYTYNKFGEVTEAFFNANNKSGWGQDKVDMSMYDPLDRVGQITDSLLGNTQTLTYDSLDAVLQMTDTANNASPVSYTYDYNGRRTTMNVTLNGVQQTPVNYGYDCDDRLIGMSNNGTAIQSCSPTTPVTNGSLSTQFAFYYEGAGVLEWMLADGVKTLNTGIDSDARITERDYYSYPDSIHYGSGGPNLTYTYDADGHVIDKGGNLAAVNIPAAWPTVAYSKTDQLSTWNTTSTNPDAASNIRNDPASGATLQWDVRNRVFNVSNGQQTETYDGLGRRESSTGSATLNFEYDGSTMIGWTSAAAGSYNFATLPGGPAIAGYYTANATTTKWAPLLDLDGSTIGLVNEANVDAGPVTTYTYDPSGTPNATGTANDWPFLFQGMEKEFTDPGTYYYTGDGQFYSPQFVRSLSETGQTSSSQGACPSGNAIGAPSDSSGSGFNFPSGVDVEPEISSEGQTGRTTITVTGAAGAGATIGAIIGAAVGQPLAGAAIGAVVGAIVGGIASVFEDLFGGSTPSTPRQLLHGRHPLYPMILGVSNGEIPDETSAGAPEFVGDLHPSNTPPLGLSQDLTSTPTPAPTPVPPIPPRLIIPTLPEFPRSLCPSGVCPSLPSTPPPTPAPVNPELTCK